MAGSTWYLPSKEYWKNASSNWIINVLSAKQQVTFEIIHLNNVVSFQVYIWFQRTFFYLFIYLAKTFWAHTIADTILEDVGDFPVNMILVNSNVKTCLHCMGTKHDISKEIHRELGLHFFFFLHSLRGIIKLVLGKTKAALHLWYGEIGTFLCSLLHE